MIPYEREGLIMAFTLEVNRDKRVIERQLFTVLDLLASIGGLQAILYSIAASTLSIYTRGSLIDAHLISELFLHGDVPVMVQKGLRGFCYRRRLRHQLGKQAKIALASEIDIVSTIRGIRSLKESIQSLIGTEKFTSISETVSKIEIEKDEAKVMK